MKKILYFCLLLFIFASTAHAASLCFLDNNCYSNGVQTDTNYRTIGYKYYYNLSGAAVINIEAVLNGYSKPYQLYYAWDNGAFNQDFTLFTSTTTFISTLLPTTVYLEARSGRDILSFTSFQIY